MSARPLVEPVEVRGEAVLDGGQPVQVRQGLALGVGDGHHRLVRVLAVEGHEVGDVQAAVQGGEAQRLVAAGERVVDVVVVEVDDVELVQAAEHLLELPHHVRELVQAPPVEAQ